MTLDRSGWSARRLATSSWMIGLGASLAMAFRLFVTSAIGMADNGDGVRLMCRLGVVPDVQHTHAALYVNFAILDFDHGPPVDPKAGCAGYPSSTVLWLRMVQWLSHLLGRSADIDLRLGLAAYCVLAGVVIALRSS